MSAYRRTRERRPISPAANRQKGSRTLDVSPLSRYPRRTRAHQAWEQSNRRDRLNPDFLRACTHVLPCSSNKTSLTIPPGRPHTRSPGTRPVDAQKPRERFMGFIISCHGLWCHRSQAPPPWGAAIQAHNQKNTAAFLAPSIFSACLLVLCAEKWTPHTHTVCGWIFL